jgi:hypothetical protein
MPMSLTRESWVRRRVQQPVKLPSYRQLGATSATLRRVRRSPGSTRLKPEVYKTLGGSFPRLQIITVRDIVANRVPRIPGRRIDPFERKGPARERKPPAGVRPAAYQLRLLP